MINEDILKEEIPDLKSDDFILYQEKDKDIKYCLNLFHDSNYFYFKLKKKEPINISLFFFYIRYDYSTLIDKLKLDSKKYIDMKSIEKILIEALNKKEVSLKNEKENSINIGFKLNNNEHEITLMKKEMNDNEKFEKIVEELKGLKNMDEDKIEDIKRQSKEIEEYGNNKCKEIKDELDSLEIQANQNKADIDNQTNEIELLKEEMKKINEQFKEDEEKINNDNNNKKDCLIF